MIGGKHYSATINKWAQPCRAWTEKGCCTRAVACWFRHDGFATHGDDNKPIQRCIICGSMSHTSKDCTCPGGNKDPKKEEVWQAYRARKEKELAKLGVEDSGGKSKGKGKKGGKGGKKGKAKEGSNSTAAAATNPGLPDAATVGAAARTTVVVAGSTTSNTTFPEGAVGLDSWANVWLKHVEGPEEGDWVELLTLADGANRACKTVVGPKGVPQAWVKKKDGNKIDLLPMHWLIERWCKVSWDTQVQLTSPKGRTMHLACWEGMPFLSALQVRQVFEDLPEANVPGRSGKPAGARVCSASITLPMHDCAATVKTSSPSTLPEPQHTGVRETRASLRRRLAFVANVDNGELAKWVDR